VRDKAALLGQARGLAPRTLWWTRLRRALDGDIDTIFKALSRKLPGLIIRH